MYNVIMIALAIAFVLRIVKRKNAESETKENETQKSGINTVLKKSIFQARPVETYQSRTTSNILVNEKKKENTNRQMYRTEVKADLPEHQRKGEAVTDFLARRSHEEDVVRKKDEWEDRREEQRNIGNLKMAQRLPFGVEPPRGSKLIICTYCGAENLVSQASHEKYHCYFCRASLPIS